MVRRDTLRTAVVAVMISILALVGGCGKTGRAKTEDRSMMMSQQMETFVQRAEQAADRAEQAAQRAEQAAERATQMANKAEQIFTQRMKK